MTDPAIAPTTGRKGGRTKRRIEPSAHRGFRILDRHWRMLVVLTLEAQSGTNEKRTPSDLLHDLLEERYLKYVEDAASKNTLIDCTNECDGVPEESLA